MTVRHYSYWFLFGVLLFTSCGYCSRVDHNFVFDSIHVTDFAVDDQCNLYMVGRKESAKTYRRFAVEKYDQNGRKCWEDIYEVLSEGFGNAGLVELDHEGNIYVAGTTEIRNKTGDGKPKLADALVKYSCDGKILWDTIFKKPGYRLELDGLNMLDDSNVCLRIASTIETEEDLELDMPELSSYSYKALVYNPDGKKVREFMFSDWPCHSAAIGKSSLCVAEMLPDSTGDFNSTEDITGEHNYFVYSILKYDPEGNRSVLIKALCSNDLMIAAGLRGSFHVGGSYRANSKQQYQPFVSKYSHTGQEIWKHLLPLPVEKVRTQRDFAPDALEVDNIGNVYVADWLRVGKEFAVRQPPIRLGSLNVPNVNLLTITKYNSNGQLQWKYDHKADSKGINLTGSILLQTQNSGNVLCISLVEEPNFSAAFHIVHLTSDGKKIFGGTVSNPSDWAKAFEKK